MRKTKMSYILERLETLRIRQIAWATDFKVLIADVSAYDNTHDETKRVSSLPITPHREDLPASSARRLDVPMHNQDHGHEF